ncbi:GyrI-like domain-containing protein [Ferruginibacter sp. HRS2-29]|uniref:GyrI-like domain-containing protein n=1 Tax=Ferruginibacter sp. HRS2-29 TaxID=2487334 RepID=UPI0020CEC681|nr:GyrI-like domain-containing protein [Ferruginibacter sp. HRS2-29]MCP9752729.1 AraC family transcriptional regulator [Ferruginibacter sp. HRS2-29]
MSIQTIPSFHIIGISVRTTNENGQAAKDIPALWNTFLSEGIATKIPGRIGDELYCIYTEYEKDHTKPYTTLLGCKVENLEKIPEGLTGKSFEEASYEKFTAAGNLQQGAVYDAWVKIWNAGLQRVFTADFEVYGQRAQDQQNAEVDIFIAVK